MLHFFSRGHDRVTVDIGGAQKVWCGAVLIVLVLAARNAAAQQPAFRERAVAAVTRGIAPQIEITGIPAGDTVTLMAFRRVVRVAGGKTDTATFRSVARFIGPAAGSMVIDRTAPISGTWLKADPFAIIWSMERTDTAIVLAPGRILAELEWRGRVVDTLVLPIRATIPEIERRWVSGDGFAGAFVRPTSSGMHPALLVLHGSEGGDSASARLLAESFANHGFATFALTYFAWGSAVPAVPPALVNIPVEVLERVRDWMGSQAGVDTSRTGIWGASKGAEFALVAASYRGWPKAVVACVPSDVVWTGFGRLGVGDERLSSWSIGGRPLSYIAYDRYDDALQGRVTARLIHDRSRLLYADSVVAARIPVEKARMPILIMGSERDEVWNSAGAVQAITRSRNAAGLAAKTTSLSYPDAGHSICGTAFTPWQLYDRTYPTETPPSARATLEAQSVNWAATVDFLLRNLAQAPP